MKKKPRWKITPDFRYGSDQASRRAASLAKYVRMKSAPARRIAVSDSRIVAVAIEPAVVNGPHHHAELAAHLIGAERHGKTIARLANDVEVRHGRLHHDHVGAFFQIEFDFAHGFARVGRIHLIAAPVAELRRRFGGFAEWSIKDRRIFGGVRNDRRIQETRAIQRLSNRRHTTVHHVAGRDQIGASAGVRHRGFRQPLERGIVLDFAIDHQSAMAVTGVFAIADIGHHQQFRNFALQGAHGLLDDAVVGISAGSQLILGFWNAEQNHAADAERVRLGAFGNQPVDGKLRVAGHGFDFAAHAFARANEQRQNEVARIEHASRGPGRAAPHLRGGAACDGSEKPPCQPS